MDARGVQRLLERIYGMADTADHVGSKNIETMQREPRLRDETKAVLAVLYRDHALRVRQLHSELGLSICDAILGDMDDDAARAALDLMLTNLRTLNDAAKMQLDEEKTNPKSQLPTSNLQCHENT